LLQLGFQLTNQIIDLRTTLRYVGLQIEGKSILFCDIQTVITSSTLTHSSLKKQHSALSYHRVREAIAAKVVTIQKVDGNKIYGYILSKNCGYQQAWPLIRLLLFSLGITLTEEDSEPHTKGESQPIAKAKVD
jgi:hypothetical protein